VQESTLSGQDTAQPTFIVYDLFCRFTTPKQAMKLTKTQQELIAQATQRGGYYGIDCASGRGPEGGRVSFGARRRTALHGLVKLGLVEITHRHTHADCNRGYTIHCTVLAFRLTNQA
jgi:hypothetical protein